MPSTNFIMRIPVIDCPECKGFHRAVFFFAGKGPEPWLSRWGTCPKTGNTIWMDVRVREATEEECDARLG